LNEASYSQLLPVDSGSTNSKQLQPAVDINATTLSPSPEKIGVRRHENSQNNNELLSPSNARTNTFKNDVKYSQVSPSSILDMHDSEPAAAKFDIFDGKLPSRDPLQRVKAEYLLANNKVTPFDSSKYIQTLFNPLAGKTPSC